MSVYLGLGTHHTHDELFLGHFEGEHRNDGPLLDRRVLGKGETKGGFTHGWSRRHNYQIGLLQSGSHLIDLTKTGREARQSMRFPLCIFMDLFEYTLGNGL